MKTESVDRKEAHRVFSSNTTESQILTDSFPFLGSCGHSRDLLVDILHGISECLILVNTDAYILARFSYGTFGYSSDVMFSFDTANSTIHVRSTTGGDTAGTETCAQRIRWLKKLYNGRQ